VRIQTARPGVWRAILTLNVRLDVFARSLKRYRRRTQWWSRALLSGEYMSWPIGRRREFALIANSATSGVSAKAAGRFCVLNRRPLFEESHIPGAER
jgi:hypothetical protein